MRQVVALIAEIRQVRRFVLADEGQDLLEYGLVAVLIAVIAVTAVGSLGITIKITFWDYIASNM